MKFRKKPVVIDAIQIDPKAEHPFAAAMAFTKELGTARVVTTQDGQPVSLHIHTLEGIMQADLGDWIIKGVKGEFYPCKPDIFDATYERVE